MIPIVSLANLLNAVVAFIIAARAHSVDVQLAKDADHTIVHYFAWFFTAFGVMWLLYALPGLFVTSLAVITVAQFLADVSAYVAVAVGLRITFFVLRQPVAEYMSTGFLVVLGTLYVIGRLYNFNLNEIEIIGPYIYYTPIVSPALQAITGVATSFGSIIFAGTFFGVYKKQRANVLVARRALYLSIGMLCMFVASTLFFILITPSFVTASIAALFSLSGFFLLQRGIPYRE